MRSSKRLASSAARALTVAITSALALACGDAGDSDERDDGVAPDPDEYLASFVSAVSAADGAIIELPEVDPSVTLLAPPAEFLPFIPVVPLEPGGTVSMSVAYEAENAN